MRKAFTFMELFTVIAIIAIIAAIAIPALIEARTPKHDPIGKVFMMGGQKVMVVDRTADRLDTYNVVILPSNPGQSPLTTTMLRTVVQDAYESYLQTHPEDAFNAQ